jgi:NADH-quinone oxidoreductase subunit F
LEGKRGNPIKPPFPAVSGLWSNPTVVNNVKLSHQCHGLSTILVMIMLKSGRSTGTKLISASGHVKILVFWTKGQLSVYEFMNSDESGMRSTH